METSRGRLTAALSAGYLHLDGRHNYAYYSARSVGVLGVAGGKGAGRLDLLANYIEAGIS